MTKVASCLYSGLSNVSITQDSPTTMSETNGLLMESLRQQIALLHAESDDVHLLNELLSDESYDLVPHNDVHTLQNQQFEAQINALDIPATWGVVVCARGSDPCVDEATCKERISHEISELSGRYKRLLVLADSMDEPTVCHYLQAGAHHVIPLADSPTLMRARLMAGLREHREPVRNELHVGPYHFDLSRLNLRTFYLRIENDFFRSRNS